MNYQLKNDNKKESLTESTVAGGRSWERGEWGDETGN